MSIAEGLAIIISSFSIIATIIGWTVVYRQQKQMIETQAKIDNEKEKKFTKLKAILSEIDSVYSWLNEGHDMVLMSEKIDAQNLKPRLLQWQLKFYKEVESSHLFDYKINRPGISDGGEVGKLICWFYEYVVAVVNARAEGDETKALEKLTKGEYKTYESYLVKADFGGFNILLPEGFMNYYVGSRNFLEALKDGLLK